MLVAELSGLLCLCMFCPLNLLISQKLEELRALPEKRATSWEATSSIYSMSATLANVAGAHIFVKKKTPYS